MSEGTSPIFEYGTRIEPITEIIILNTIVFLILGVYYSLVVSKYPLLMSYLFVGMWWFSCCNQGFILGCYYKLYRYMDFLFAITLSFFLFYRAFLNPHGVIPLSFIMIITLYLCWWQICSKTKDEFIFRVQIWHFFCGMLIAALIYFEIK
tara:strand:- start:828 stop:1277 length:450 start_codon:yes stop_codon:yes gene_type:complete